MIHKFINTSNSLKMSDVLTHLWRLLLDLEIDEKTRFNESSL